MKKIVIALLFATTLCSSSHLQAQKPEAAQVATTQSTRREANAIDVLIFSGIAEVINQSFESGSLTTNLLTGTGAWLSGEALEMIYKKVYKKITGTQLRETLGTTKLRYGIEFDNQRLLRRIITLVPLCVILYLTNMS